MRIWGIVNVERRGLAKSTKYFGQAFLNNICVFCNPEHNDRLILTTNS